MRPQPANIEADAVIGGIMETGNQIALFDSQTGPIYAVAFAPDGTVLTGGYDRTIRDWPAAGGDGVVLFAGAPG